MLVTLLSLYPVVETNDSENGLFGMKLKSGYDTVYALVDDAGRTVSPNTTQVVNEVFVVDQTSQILPWMLLEIKQ